MFLLLVFQRLLQPNRHITLKWILTFVTVLSFQILMNIQSTILQISEVQATPDTPTPVSQPE